MTLFSIGLATTMTERKSNPSKQHRRIQVLGKGGTLRRSVAAAAANPRSLPGPPERVTRSPVWGRGPGPRANIDTPSSAHRARGARGQDPHGLRRGPALWGESRD